MIADENNLYPDYLVCMFFTDQLLKNISQKRFGSGELILIDGENTVIVFPEGFEDTFDAYCKEYHTLYDTV